MKEIEYIFQNLDTKGFLDKLEEWSGDQFDPGFLVLKYVKNSNEKIEYLVNYLIIKGIFFQKVKELSLIYQGYINFKDFEDFNVSISCFYSKIDNKYRLLFYSYGDKHFYELVNTYENKPSISEIKDDLNIFTKNMYPEIESNLEFFNYEDTILSLNDEEKKIYKDQINLER